MFRLIAILFTSTLIFLGVGASAFSLTLGAVDQAIAFFWPAIALAVILAFLAPMGHSSDTDQPA